MTIIIKLRTRVPITVPAIEPIDWPLLRILAQMADISWTPAIKMVPSTTQMMAGTQPQITAIAGPMIGAAPATN